MIFFLNVYVQSNAFRDTNTNIHNFVINHTNDTAKEKKTTKDTNKNKTILCVSFTSLKQPQQVYPSY